MTYIFTICSNNYLAQASVLGESIKRHEKNVKFIIFLCDRKLSDINYHSLADEVIEVAEVEPDIENLAIKYNIIELNTAVKPTVAQYLFEKYRAEIIVYLDPDCKLYNGLREVYESLKDRSIVLLPHIYTPIPIDGKTPGENVFLNYGVYNLGFIGLRNTTETQNFLSWWKNTTYSLGRIDVENGIFVDQLPINHVPLFFNGVKILRHWGMNVAPWNLHERYLTKTDNKSFLVNKSQELVFYHFSSFKMEPLELPLSQYNRFTLADRPDLIGLYSTYKDELLEKGYLFYKDFDSFYTGICQTSVGQNKKRWYRGLLKRRSR